MKQITKFLVPVFAVLIAVLMAVSSFAQEQNDMLSVSSSTFGEIQSAQAIESYFLEVTEPQVISLEVLTMTEGFSPSFVMYNSEGQVMPIIADAMSGWGVDMKVSIPAAGLYRIVIGALDNSFGQYLLRVSKIGSYIGHEYNLALNAPVEALINGNYEMHRYNFTAQSGQALSIYISSNITDTAVRVSLSNQSRSQEAGAMDMPIPASIFCIPAGTDNYSLDLMSPAGLVEGSYRLLLVANPMASCEESLAFSSLGFSNLPFTDNTSNGTVNNETATGDGDDTSHPTAGTGCSASPSNLVNVRALPSTNSEIIATVDTVSSVEVLGYILNTSWVQVRLLDGSIGYMSAGLLNIASVCVNVQIPSLTLGELGIEDAVINLDADVDLGDEVEVDADVDLGEGEVDVDADVDLGEGEVDVDADVDLGEDEADVDANVNLGGGNSEAEVDVDVELGDTEIDVELNVPGQP